LQKIGEEVIGFVVAPADVEIDFDGKVYVVDINKLGEYNPILHKKLY